jgi:hypothetical protein
MTKEQILTAITQAVQSGTVKDIDTGFVSTVKTINGTPLRFFVGTQSAYDALSDAQKTNLFAIISNDVTKDGLLSAIENLQSECKSVADLCKDIVNGQQMVANAQYAVNAHRAEKLKGQTFSKYTSGVLPSGVYLFRIKVGTKTFTATLCITGNKDEATLGVYNLYLFTVEANSTGISVNQYYTNEEGTFNKVLKSDDNRINPTSIEYRVIV